MPEADRIERKNKEKRRLTRQLKQAGVSKQRIDTLKQTIEQTAWMSARLDDALEEIAETPLTSTYDNGGGQKGEKVSPALQSYESLWKSYIAGVRLICDAMPEEVKAKPDDVGTAQKPKTVLELIEAKRRA